MARERMSYVDSAFYVVLGEDGWWMCNPESPYDRKYGKENIATDCGNPMNAVRFDFAWDAERYIDENWPSVGGKTRPVVELVELKVSVKTVKKPEPWSGKRGCAKKVQKKSKSRLTSKA